NGDLPNLLPPFLANEDSLKKWIEDTVAAALTGGSITMLKHWPPKYAENEKVGKIWIVPAVVDVEMGAKREHEIVFLVYHVESQNGEIEVAWAIPDKTLPRYIGGITADVSTPIRDIAAKSTQRVGPFENR